MSFPRGTEMFHFPRYGSLSAIEFTELYPDMTRDGLPHSDILGSKPVCDSPRRIAAYLALS